MEQTKQLLNDLKSKARPDQINGMARYGMTAEKRLGVSIPDTRKLANQFGKNHQIALELWQTGIPDARILAAMIDEPEKVTEAQMDAWVKDLNSWDVCDQLCMNLFEKTPLAKKKILEWSQQDEEFVKRAAFALIACLAWHDKKASDDQFIQLFPVIKTGSTDARNYVKKAVSWALRNIGKRNENLNRASVEAAKEMALIDSKAARWIASDVIRDIEKEAVQKRINRE